MFLVNMKYEKGSDLLIKGVQYIWEFIFNNFRDITQIFANILAEYIIQKLAYRLFSTQKIISLPKG